MSFVVFIKPCFPLRFFFSSPANTNGLNIYADILNLHWHQQERSLCADSMKSTGALCLWGSVIISTFRCLLLTYCELELIVVLEGKLHLVTFSNEFALDLANEEIRRKISEKIRGRACRNI